MHHASCIKHHASCIMHLAWQVWGWDLIYKINQVVMVDGRQPLVEDDFWWILACCLLHFASFSGSMLPQYMSLCVCYFTLCLFCVCPKFGRRRPSVEDNLRRKTTCGGRQHLVEDDLRWSTTFSGRWSSLDPCMLPTPLCSIFSKMKPTTKMKTIAFCNFSFGGGRNEFWDYVIVELFGD